MANIEKAGLAAAGTVLAFGALLGGTPASAAPAETSGIEIMATCGKTYDVYVGPTSNRRGESHYSISCSTPVLPPPPRYCSSAPARTRRCSSRSPGPGSRPSSDTSAWRARR